LVVLASAANLELGIWCSIQLSYGAPAGRASVATPVAEERQTARKNKPGKMPGLKKKWMRSYIAVARKERAAGTLVPI
jgi:hypothetical protein